MAGSLQRTAPVLGAVALVVALVMVLAVAAASLVPRAPTGDASGRPDKQTQSEKREAKRQAKLDRQQAKLDRQQARRERLETGQHAAGAPETAVHVTGIVGATTAAAGGTADYTIAAGGRTYRLSAGPAWWWGADHPLARVVGHSVTIDGTIAPNSDVIDVLAIDGTAIRSPGRPPWAGGWKVVGGNHPPLKPYRAVPGPSPSPGPSASP